MARTIIIIFGPQGSGKGTQAELLSEFLNLPTISVGELLRREVKTGSALGKHVKKVMLSGKLLDIKLVDRILKRRLAKRDVQRGFLLDGYPREMGQLKILLGAVKKTDQLYFIVIKLPVAETLKRLSGRRICDCGASYHVIYNKPRRSGKCDLCGKKLRRRADDMPGAIKKRLKIYHDKTKPMFKIVTKRGPLIFIDGKQDIKKTQKEIRTKLKAYDAFD